MVNRGVAPLRALQAEAAGSEGPQKARTAIGRGGAEAGVHGLAGNRTKGVRVRVPPPALTFSTGGMSMHFKGNSTHRGRAAHKHRSRRAMRRKRADSDALHDTMRDGRRRYKTGAAK